MFQSLSLRMSASSLPWLLKMVASRLFAYHAGAMLLLDRRSHSSDS